jgi:hypothetical protein
MKKAILNALLGVTAAFLISGAASAANVNPDVIFGSGNANGGFTVGTSNNIEVGLRAKQRFPVPANIFNYDGVDTYNFNAGESAPGSGRPLWSFEWSINTDVAGTSGAKVQDFTYQLRLDHDPSAGQSFTSFDPIMGPAALLGMDHSFGDNSTLNGQGVEVAAGDAPGYANLIANNNVVQNSWQYQWFTVIDPLIAGLYRIEMDVLGVNGDVLSTAGINVVVSAVPLPAALPLYGAGMAVLGFLGWRRKQKAA